MTDVLRIKLESILSIADKVQVWFTLASQLNAVSNIFQKIADSHKAILVRGLIACDEYPFMLIAKDPRKILVEYIMALRELNDQVYQESFNPVSLRPKLGEREWLLTMNSNRVCYAIAAHPSSYLLKAFTCRCLTTVVGYDKYIDKATMRFSETTIKEIHPQYDYNTTQITQNPTAYKHGRGGPRKHFGTLNEKKRIKLRMKITAQVIEHIQKTPAISQGIIFVNNLEDSAKAAISLIFTERKYKDAVTGYIKELVAGHYDEYTSKSYLNAEFNVPYDFRMKKFSVIINNIKQCVCLLHLYNIATYEPVPCSRHITGEYVTQIAHPIVKLRLLNTNLYFAQKKLGNTFKPDHVRLVDVYNEVLDWDKYPTWIGFFICESYEKNKRNLNTKEQPEILVI